MAHAPHLDRVFQALSHPTRLAVIDRLAHGPAGASELAQPFDMSLPSFMQHLDVLERGGLVHSRKEGRVRTYRLQPKSLKAAEGWMAERRDLWERRLDGLDDYLVTMKERSE